MSTDKANSKPNISPAKQQGWLDYLLMFIFIPVLNQKYPVHSPEPVHRVTTVIVFLAKAPVYGLSMYSALEYVFQHHLLSGLAVFLPVIVVAVFWEFVYHRVIHINEHVLNLLEQRNTRQCTQTLLKYNPDLGKAMMWLSVIVIVAYLCVCFIYSGFLIITPEPAGF